MQPSDVNLFSDLDCIVDLDAEAPIGDLEL